MLETRVSYGINYVDKELKQKGLFIFQKRNELLKFEQFPLLNFKISKHVLGKINNDTVLY